MTDADLERLKKCVAIAPEVPFICVDVANGYSEHFVDFVRRVRETFPSHILIAGNVVTQEMVEELVLSGADIVKVRPVSLHTCPPVYLIVLPCLLPGPHASILTRPLSGL